MQNDCPPACVPSLDQSVSASPILSSESAETHWQSFQPGRSGFLTSFSALLPAGLSLDVSIYQGEGIGGTLLSSGDTIANSSGGFNTVELGTPVAVTANSTYTFALASQSGAVSVSYLITNSYGRGRSGVNANYDFDFRTFVAPCLDSAEGEGEAEGEGQGEPDPCATRFFEDFSNTLASANQGAPLRSGWTVFNGDGNTINSSIAASFTGDAWEEWFEPIEERPVVRSASSFESVAQADRWLISPALTIGNEATLSWEGRSSDDAQRETYEVRILTAAPELGGFSERLTLISNEPGDAWTPHTLDLAAAGYTNREVYIAFRNISVDQEALLLTDIEVCDATADGFGEGEGEGGGEGEGEGEGDGSSREGEGAFDGEGIGEPCDESLDQASDPIGPISLVVGVQHWQSFRAGKSGFLSRVEAVFPSIEVQLLVYEGTGIQGPLLSAGDFATGADGFVPTSIPLTTPVEVIQGETYTFVLAGLPGEYEIQYFEGNPYDRGLAGLALEEFVDLDMEFNTYVTPCIDPAEGEGEGLAEGEGEAQLPEGEGGLSTTCPDNLVADGGFEQGDWTAFGTAGLCDLVDCPIEGAPAFEGTGFAALLNSFDNVSQEMLVPDGFIPRVTPARCNPVTCRSRRGIPDRWRSSGCQYGNRS